MGVRIERRSPRSEARRRAAPLQRRGTLRVEVHGRRRHVAVELLSRRCLVVLHWRRLHKRVAFVGRHWLLHFLVSIGGWLLLRGRLSVGLVYHIFNALQRLQQVIDLIGLLSSTTWTDALRSGTAISLGARRTRR